MCPKQLMPSSRAARCDSPIARYTNLSAMSLTELWNSASVLKPGMGGRPKQGGMYVPNTFVKSAAVTHSKQHAHEYH